MTLGNGVHCSVWGLPLCGMYRNSRGSSPRLMITSKGRFIQKGRSLRSLAVTPVFLPHTLCPLNPDRPAFSSLFSTFSSIHSVCSYPGVSNFDSRSHVLHTTSAFGQGPGAKAGAPQRCGLLSRHPWHRTAWPQPGIPSMECAERTFDHTGSQGMKTRARRRKMRSREHR